MNAKKLFLAALAAFLTLPAVANAQSQAQATPAADWLPVNLKLGGYFWLDTGFMQRNNTQAGLFDQDTPYMQGRFGLLAGYEKTLGSLNVDAQVEFLGLENEFGGDRFEPHVLNAFLKFGQKKWDVQLGRFLNSEVFYRGQGIELYTPDEFGAEGAPGIYHLDTIRGHQDQPGQIAVHYMPWQNVKLEVASVYGFDNTQQTLGVRPMLDVGYAGFRFFAGYEYLTLPSNTEQVEAEDTTEGWAARLQYSLPFVTIGANYSSKEFESINLDQVLRTDVSGDFSSVGGFADIYFGAKRHSLGLGYYHTEFTDRRELRNTATQDQAFVTYLHQLPIDGFSVKGVAGFARAENEDRQNTRTSQNDLYSFRIRVAYDFQ